MSIVAKLGVADVIKDGSIHYIELAKAVNAVPDKLHRVIRYLSSEGLFVISEEGMVSLTSQGQLLREDRDDTMKWCCIHWVGEVEASMSNLYNEVLTGEESFEKTHGGDLFEVLGKNPKSQENFTKCMKGLQNSIVPTVIAEYDFSQHEFLLDLGGGMGFLTRRVLQMYDSNATPSSKLTKAIVFDLSTVVPHGDVKNPILQYVSGSFFDVTTIPTGANVTLINGVLHDWNDEECVAILSNAAAAMAVGGRILVVDTATPNPWNPLFYSASRFDVFMMSISSGFFRTNDEYNKLWSSANLKLVEVRPTRSMFSIWILEK